MVSPRLRIVGSVLVTRVSLTMPPVSIRVCLLILLANIHFLLAAASTSLLLPRPPSAPLRRATYDDLDSGGVNSGCMMWRQSTTSTAWEGREQDASTECSCLAMKQKEMFTDVPAPFSLVLLFRKSALLPSMSSSSTRSTSSLFTSCRTITSRSSLRRLRMTATGRTSVRSSSTLPPRASR